MKAWQVIVFYISLVGFILFILFFGQVIPFSFEIIIFTIILPVLLGSFIYYGWDYFSREYRPKEMKRKWTPEDLRKMTMQELLNLKKNPYCYNIIGKVKIIDNISKYEIMPGAGVLGGKMYYFTRTIIGQTRLIFYFDDKGHYETLPLDDDYLYERNYWLSPIDYLKDKTISIQVPKIEEEKEKGKTT